MRRSKYSLLLLLLFCLLMLLGWLAIRNPLSNARELRIVLTLIYSRGELNPESFTFSSFLDHAELRFALFASLELSLCRCVFGVWDAATEAQQPGRAVPRAVVHVLATLRNRQRQVTAFIFSPCLLLLLLLLVVIQIVCGFGWRRRVNWTEHFGGG